MNILRLEPPIDLVTEDGEVQAFLVIDRGVDIDLEWVCWTEARECWTYLNADVRRAENITAGRLPLTVEELFDR